MIAQFEEIQCSLKVFLVALLCPFLTSAQRSLEDILPRSPELSRRFVLWRVPAGSSLALVCENGGRIAEWYVGFKDYLQWRQVHEFGYKVDAISGRLLLPWNKGWQWEKHLTFVCSAHANRFQYHAIDITWPTTRKIHHKVLIVTLESKGASVNNEKEQQLMYCSSFAKHKPSRFPSERTALCPAGYLNVPSGYSFAFPSAPAGLLVTEEEFLASKNGSLIFAAFVRAVRIFCTFHGCHLQSTSFNAIRLCPSGPADLCAAFRPQNEPCGKQTPSPKLCSSRIRPFLTRALQISVKLELPAMRTRDSCSNVQQEFESSLQQLAHWWSPKFQPLARFFRPTLRYAEVISGDSTLPLFDPVIMRHKPAVRCEEISKSDFGPVKPTCPPGHAFDEFSECWACPLGFYQDEFNARSCKACPTSSPATRLTGSISVECQAITKQDFEKGSGPNAEDTSVQPRQKAKLKSLKEYGFEATQRDALYLMGIGIFASLLSLMYWGSLFFLIKGVFSQLAITSIKATWKKMSDNLAARSAARKQRLKRMETVDISAVQPPFYERFFKAVSNVFISHVDESVWDGYLGPAYYFLWSEDEEEDEDDEGWSEWKQNVWSHLPSLRRKKSDDDGD